METQNPGPDQPLFYGGPAGGEKTTSAGASAEKKMLKTLTQPQLMAGQRTGINFALTERQELFLNLVEREGLFYGPNASGKSYALLMAALKFVKVPGYSAIIFRPTFEDLAIPGSIMDLSKEWLEHAPEVKWSQADLRWTFPSGATLQFGHLSSYRSLTQNADDEADDQADATGPTNRPNRLLRYAACQFQFIGFDNLDSFTEEQYAFFMTKLCGIPGIDMPLVLRSTATWDLEAHPEQAKSWVYKRFITQRYAEGRADVFSGLPGNPYIETREIMF
jgi:hypothetical protein